MNQPPSPDRLILDLVHLPPEGKQFTGELPPSVFDLEKGGPRAVTGLRYDLWIERRGDFLVATGELEAEFELSCVRCLEFFPEFILLEDTVIEEELTGNPANLDLTERMREDILLALPAYPRCDEASEPRSCPATGSFKSESSYSPLEQPRPEAASGRPTVWGALDAFKLPTPRPQQS
jgi:uncharacterized protein